MRLLQGMRRRAVLCPSGGLLQQTIQQREYISHDQTGHVNVSKVASFMLCFVCQGKKFSLITKGIQIN